MATKVIIINGKHKSGRKTFGNKIGNSVHNVSLFDYKSYLNTVAKHMGWKDDGSEDSLVFIGKLKHIWNKYNDGILKEALGIYTDIHEPKRKILKIVLYIVHDSSDITELMKALPDADITTVLMYRNILGSMLEQSDNYNYDYVVNNTGTIDNLYREIRLFIKKYINTFARMDNDIIVNNKPITKRKKK